MKKLLSILLTGILLLVSTPSVFATGNATPSYPDFWRKVGDTLYTIPSSANIVIGGSITAGSISLTGALDINVADTEALLVRDGATKVLIVDTVGEMVGVGKTPTATLDINGNSKIGGTVSIEVSNAVALDMGFATKFDYRTTLTQMFLGLRDTVQRTLTIGDYGDTSTDANVTGGADAQIRFTSTGDLTKYSNIYNSGANDRMTFENSNDDFFFDGSPSYSDDLINTQVKADPVVTLRGSDILTDGELEIWSDSSTLTNWTNLTGGAGATLAREASIIHGGTYAALMTSEVGGTPMIVEQLHTGLTAGTTYNAVYWARYNTAGSSQVLAFDDTFATATQIFKFSGASSPSWQTYTGSEHSDPDYSSPATLTGSYVEYTSDDFTVPASGKISLVIGSGGGPSNSAYLDDIDLATPASSTPAATIDIFDLTNPSDISKMTSDDVLLKMGLTGGTPVDLVEWSALGSYAFTSPTGHDIGLALVNQTEENTAGGRHVGVDFVGFKSDSTDHSLASFRVFHSGTGDDQKGVFQIGVNDGDDDDDPTIAMTIPYDGNVGIGTTSPVVRLHIKEGAGTVYSPLAETVVIYQSNETTSTNSRFGYLAGTAGETIIDMGDVDDQDITSIRHSNVTNNLSFRTGGVSDRLTIDSTGKVGIGTDSPNGNLHVFDSSVGTVTPSGNADTLVLESAGNAGMSILANTFGTIYFGKDGSDLVGAMTYDYSLDSLNFYTDYDDGGTVQKMAILGDGNVGIGTATPSDQLTVRSSGSADSNIKLQTASTGGLTTDGFNFALEEATLDVYFNQRENADMLFWTNGSQKMVLKSDGNVGIGTNSPDGKLHIGELGTATVGTTTYNSGDRLFSSSVWDTDDTVARTIDFQFVNELTSGASPYASLYIKAQTDGGGYSNVGRYISNGNYEGYGNYALTGYMNSANGYYLGNTGTSNDASLKYGGDDVVLSGKSGTSGSIILDASDSVVEQNSLKRGTTSEAVADEAHLDLPDATSGWGYVQAGDNEEFARFRWTTAGVVTLDDNTTNVASTDTDTNLCIFDNGTSVRIKNRLGSSKTIKYLINY